MELLTLKETEEIFERFKKNNPEPKTELIAPNPYCLLVSVVLSAQTTDKGVNRATKSLYQKIQTPEQMLEFGQENLENEIRTIGLYKNKAKNVINLSKILIEKFNSSVPNNMQDLLELPGVGRKTANVILNVVYKKNVMPVDTHILRVAPKLGLCPQGNPEQVEKALLEKIPIRYMNHAHHWLILHGRYVCTARNPKCTECFLNDLCKSYQLKPMQIP